MAAIGQSPAESPAASAHWPQSAPQTSVRLGRWELTALAGEGAFCRVYRARPAGTPGRPASYAVKVLDERWQHQPAAIATIAREAEVGRAVRHPHLAAILDAHLSGAPHHLVMPWLEGQSLEERLATGRLPLADCLWLARQAAEALAALEAAGWMHGDVKPANVMIGPNGHATLIDFGFARRPRDTASILDRAVLGTIHYIAPEVLVDSQRADIRSDIYSLGVVLYQMLTGRRPLEGESVAELARAHREQRPAALRNFAPEVPSGVASLVHRMLSKEPLRRPSSPASLVQRLAGFEIDNLACR